MSHSALTENFHHIEEEFQNGASSVSGQAAGMQDPEVANGTGAKRKRKKSKSQSSGTRPTTITIGLPTCIQVGNVFRRRF